VARVEKTKARKILMAKCETKRTLGKPRTTGEDNIKME
jgi:hypothetical protein